MFGKRLIVCSFGPCVADSLYLMTGRQSVFGKRITLTGLSPCNSENSVSTIDFSVFQDRAHPQSHGLKSFKNAFGTRVAFSVFRTKKSPVSLTAGEYHAFPF